MPSTGLGGAARPSGSSGAIYACVCPDSHAATLLSLQVLQVFTLGADNSRGLFFPSGINATYALNGSSTRIGLNVPSFTVNVSPSDLLITSTRCGASSWPAWQSSKLCL